jgi:hypothetical protein
LECRHSAAATDITVVISKHSLQLWTTILWLHFLVIAKATQAKMFSYLYSTIVIYVFVTICPWCILTKNNHNLTHSRNLDRRSKILLTNDGPTTIGGKTTFSAEVLNCNGKKYRFCWHNHKGEQCNTIEGPKAILVVGNWLSIGKKVYNLEVERTSPGYEWCGKNATTVLVTGK